MNQRLTPGAPLPGGVPIRVSGGEYADYEGVVQGHTTVDGKLTSYSVLIKRPHQEEGMEFVTNVRPEIVKLQR